MTPYTPPAHANLHDEVQTLILEAVFAGNPHRWLHYLLACSTPDQRSDDLPFVLSRICGDRSDGTEVSA